MSGGSGVPYVRVVREMAWQDPRWRPDRRGPHKDWPGGAVVAASLFHVLGAGSQADESGGLPLSPGTVALLLIGPLALYWRRKAPIAVLAVASAGSLAYALLAAPHWMYAVAPLIALFNATKMGRSRPAFLTVAAAYAAYLLLTSFLGPQLRLAGDARLELRTTLWLAAMLLVTMFLGTAAKAQSEHMAEMMKVRAERAKAKAEQERRQASEERLRMARELHDVLGHHLSLINVQAGVGLHLMDNQPEQAREALTAIKTASSEALREVRAVLGVLRPEEEAAPRQPALGLDRLDELTADAGLPVTTTTSGERRPLPAEVDRAAYRIVQEALTNVRKHAAPEAKAEVTVDYAADGLRLSVRNDGPAADEPGGDGSGITGMRARAEALGGSLQAGPLPGGGFLVTAVLPMGETT
jgi:signal transduction histidine kinase